MTTSKHEHSDCKHEMKFCGHCDVAFCDRCNTEWGKYKLCTLQHYPYYYVGIPNYTGYLGTTTISDTYTSNTGTTNTTDSYTHVHK